MSKFEVIIIGGGISGLAAANELIKSGIKNVLVLEGNDRLGGRINTVRDQGIEISK
jgi:monoamine oxidase